MKTITLMGLAGMVFLSLAQPTWAGGHGGGGGFGGGGHFGGFAGGGSRAAPAFYGDGLRTAPAFRGAYFPGRSIGGVSPAQHVYYAHAGLPAAGFHTFTPVGNRPAPQVAGRTSPIRGQQDRAALVTSQNTRVASSQVSGTNRQSNRIGSNARRNGISDPQRSTATSRQSFVKNHASERHDGNWHSDWDRHHAHFHDNRVFVFVDGFWWGLYPWDYDSYYGNGYGYPYDYSNSYPSDYSNGYPYGYYDSSYPTDYYDQPSYAGSQQSVAYAAVSAVQSELAKLGYYNGVIDGTLGDETEAALARYQEDNGLSVTGVVDGATLQSLGIR